MTTARSVLAAAFLFHASVASADERTRAVEYAKMARVHESKKQFSAALYAYSKAIDLDPQYSEAYFSRSAIYDGHPSMKKRDYPKAAADLTRALEIKPRWFAARFNRALCYESLREYDKAIADYSTALDADTDFSNLGYREEKARAQTYHYRGRAYQWYKKDYALAVADFGEALRLDSEIEMVHYRRGQALYELKEYEKAEKDFKAELERKPNYPNLLNAYAWQLATCPEARFRDGGRAVELAIRSNEESGGKRADTLDVLAAAHAEVDQFDEAVKWQKLAIESLGRNDGDLRKNMQARLKLYEVGKPYRSE